MHVVRAICTAVVLLPHEHAGHALLCTRAVQQAHATGTAMSMQMQRPPLFPFVRVSCYKSFLRFSNANNIVRKMLTSCAAQLARRACADTGGPLAVQSDAGQV